MERLKRLYFDTCCLSRLYDNLTNPTVYDEAQAVIQIQGDISKDVYVLVWSYVLNREVFQIKDQNQLNEILVWGDIASYTVRRSTPDIVKQSNLLQSIGLKPFDAAHIACAIEMYCDYFITTDRRVLNASPLISEINVIDPVAFVALMKGANIN